MGCRESNQGQSRLATYNAHALPLCNLFGSSGSVLDEGVHLLAMLSIALPKSPPSASVLGSKVAYLTTFQGSTKQTLFSLKFLQRTIAIVMISQLTIYLHVLLYIYFIE